MACKMTEIQKMDYEYKEMFRDRSMKIDRNAKKEEELQKSGKGVK